MLKFQDFLIATNQPRNIEIFFISIEYRYKKNQIVLFECSVLLQWIFYECNLGGTNISLTWYSKEASRKFEVAVVEILMMWRILENISSFFFKDVPRCRFLQIGILYNNGYWNSFSCCNDKKSKGLPVRNRPTTVEQEKFFQNPLFCTLCRITMLFWPLAGAVTCKKAKFKLTRSESLFLANLQRLHISFDVMYIHTPTYTPAAASYNNNNFSDTWYMYILLCVFLSEKFGAPSPFLPSRKYIRIAHCALLWPGIIIFQFVTVIE